jgi:hypothetical protein
MVKKEQKESGYEHLFHGPLDSEPPQAWIEAIRP